MTILLCTPFAKSSQANWGGISVWANNIISYAERNGKEQGIQLFPVSFDRFHKVSLGMNPLLRIWYGYLDIRKAIKNTKKVLHRTNIDVIHVCSSASFSLLKDIYLLLLAKKHNKKIVFHYHFGLIPELKNKGNLEWLLLRFVAGHADNTIVMTMDSLHALQDSELQRVSYLPNPITEVFGATLSKWENIVERVPGRIAYVGHIVPNKGVREIVESCRSLDHVDIRLIGEAPSDTFVTTLNTMMNGAATGTTLSFIGKVPQDDVVKELLSTELFIFPSYFEGFPNAILEAMACGCPIIASNVGAIPEMLDINDSPCGICIPSHDADALRKAIIVLRNDPEKRLELAKNAKHRVETEYNTNRIWQRLKEIWSES